MLIWFHKISKDIVPTKMCMLRPCESSIFWNGGLSSLTVWRNKIVRNLSEKELDVSVMSSKLGNAPPLSCWFKKPVEHTIVNGIWLITLHATPPAVCAGWKWNSLGEWRGKASAEKLQGPSLHSAPGYFYAFYFPSNELFTFFSVPGAT